MFISIVKFYSSARARTRVYLDIAAATEAKTTTAVAKPGTRMPRMPRVFRRAAAVARRSTSSSDGRGVSDAANAMRAARSAGKDAARAVKAAVTRRSSAGEASGIESAERCSVESAGGRRQTPHLERLGSLTDASINAAFDEFDANHSGTALVHASAFSFASPQYHGRFSASRTGQLDARELRDALRHLGVETNTLEAARMLRTFDTDGSGMIERGEFLLIVRRLLIMRAEGAAGGGGCLERARGCCQVAILEVSRLGGAVRRLLESCSRLCFGGESRSSSGGGGLGPRRGGGRDRIRRQREAEITSVSERPL